MIKLTFKERYDIYDLAEKKAGLIQNVVSWTILAIFLLPPWLCIDSWWISIIVAVAVYFTVSKYIVAPVERCIFKLTYKSLKQKRINNN